MLEGKTDELAAQLEAEMKLFASRKEFEKAAERKRQWELVLSLDLHQKVETQRSFDQDVIATLAVENTLKFEVFQIKRGVIGKREKFTVPIMGPETMSEFLRAYYSVRIPPAEIIVDTLPADASALESFFGDKAGRNVSITLPERGDKKKLLDMARQNASVDLQEEQPALAELARVLKLKALPSIIECFDISHLGATDVVAASVQYKDAEPNPSEFRRYEIKTVEGQDDFRSMYEAVFRRYDRLKRENSRVPDLVVIDGGKVQLAFARKALQAAGLSIPIIALAKKEEEIYLPYLSIAIRLPKNNPALKLLMRIRDSTHRFVLGYQKVKRGKRMLQ